MKASFENEEKVYSITTLEVEFANDRVLIVLKKNILKSYTIEVFYGVVENVSELPSSISINNIVSFLQLEEKSKQYVLNIINQLIEREDVVYSGLGYKIKFNSANSVDEDLSEQRVFQYIELTCESFYKIKERY